MLTVSMRELFRGLRRTPPLEVANPPDEPNSAALAAAPIHVFADDGLVHMDDGHLTIRRRSDPPIRVQVVEIAQVSIHGEASITTPCLRALVQRGIPVIYRSHSGHYVGQVVDLSGATSAVRRAQYSAAANPERTLHIARGFVHAKIVNARGAIRRREGANNHVCDRLTRLAGKARSAGDIESLRGIEGAAAALYFEALPSLIGPDRRSLFSFDGRRRRPPTDPVNALLSYLYAILAGECAAAALAAGLDPNVGFLHAERPGRPALALDLLEPLRPAICDSVALGLINRGEIGPADFRREQKGACLLNASGRKIVLGALERRLAQSSVGELETPKGVRALIASDASALASALRHGTPYAPRLLYP